MQRRKFLQRTGVGSAVFSLAPTAGLAQARLSNLEASTLGLIPDSAANQTALFSLALAKATASGATLKLPAGRFVLGQIELPANCSIEGAGPNTVLALANGNNLLSAKNRTNISLKNLAFEGNNIALGNVSGGLLAFDNCQNIAISTCSIKNHNSNGMLLNACSGRIVENNFSNFALSAIHGQNSTGMQISFNRISNCNNGGIRVWRNENGFDGTIVTNNQITDIGSQSGNGQNGNGINIYLADGVVVANNIISNCDFSAIRANSTNDIIIEGNQCSNSLEVAIFSEFAFSGSIISSNIINGAAQGISIANLDVGGRLAICSNNIVRNITEFSPTNPDTVPVGIFAEADTAIVSNVVENVPGAGIVAGWGPFLRNVMIANNIVRQTKIAIAASVADGAGIAKISDNMIVGASIAAIAGMAWDQIISNDLIAEANKYPNIYLADNIVS